MTQNPPSHVVTGYLNNTVGHGGNVTRPLKKPFTGHFSVQGEDIEVLVWRGMPPAMRLG